jgi:hypothetical protein
MTLSIMVVVREYNVGGIVRGRRRSGNHNEDEIAAPRILLAAFDAQCSIIYAASVVDIQ